MISSDWVRLVSDLRNPDTAADAADRLHKSASAEDLPRLVELLQDCDGFVRESAAWPISEIAGSAMLEDLLVTFQQGFDDGLDNDGFTTLLIELALAERERCQALLAQIAWTAEEPLRENARWLLSHIQSEQ